MPYTFTTQFRLRHIPFENIMAVYVLWDRDCSKRSGWSLEETCRHYLKAGGEDGRMCFQPLEYGGENPCKAMGFEKRFYYREGGWIKVCALFSWEEDCTRVWNHITISGTHARPFLLFPLRVLQEYALSEIEFALDLSVVEPEAAFTETPRGELIGFLSYNPHDTFIDTYSFLNEDGTISFKAEEGKTEPVELPENVQSEDEAVPSDYYKLLAENRRQKNRIDDLLQSNENLDDLLDDEKRKVRNLERDLAKARENLESEKEKNVRLRKKISVAEANARLSADEQFNAFCKEFDCENTELKAENEKLKTRVGELERQAQIDQGKIVSLKGRLGKLEGSAGTGDLGGLLSAPENEQEKFDGEFGIALFSALHKAIEKTPTKTVCHGKRAIDVWKAIVEANPDVEAAFRRYSADRDALLTAMKGNQLDKNKHLLKPLGLDFSTHTNNHGDITFGDGDRRYTVSSASTASETKSGPSNCANDLKNALLYPT